MSTYKTLAKAAAPTLESVSAALASAQEDIEGTLWLIQRHLRRILNTPRTGNKKQMTPPGARMPSTCSQPTCKN